eukprot:766858-Hanusia_phi.AAC.10
MHDSGALWVDQVCPDEVEHSSCHHGGKRVGSDENSERRRGPVGVEGGERHEHEQGACIEMSETLNSC